MGATSFFTRSTGNSPTEAYNEAVREARYEYGHGGYTGTIAEKSGYMLFNIPLSEMPPREVARQHYTRDGYVSVMVAQSLEDRLANAIYWYTDKAWSYDFDARKTATRDPFATADDPIIPDWMSEDQRDEWLENQAAWRADALLLSTKMGRRNWDNLCESFNDKWGPAVAVKTGDNEWLFFGMASC